MSVTEMAGTQDARRDPAPALATAWLLLLALAALAIHLVFDRGYHVFRDEFYYLACGDHLAWGYVDHPPAVALMARLGRAWFGDSPAGLRFIPALLHAVTVFVAGAIARDLGGRRFAQALAALAAVLAPQYLGGNNLITTNGIELMWWALALWIAVRLLRGADPRLWLALGVVTGLGLLSKHSMAFLLAGLAAGLLLTPERRLLRTRWPWLGALVALALVAPHLVWQVQHGWPTLEFLRNAQARKNAPVSPLEFIMGQIVIQLPLTFPVWLAGLAWLLFAPSARAWRALGIAYLAIFAIFVLTRAKVYYLSPFYPVLYAAGAVVLAGWTARPRLAWLGPATVVLWLAAAALIAPLALPVLPPEKLEAYLQRTGLAEPRTERHRPPRLTQTFADEFGWEEMVAKVARVYASLDPAERAKCAIYGGNYGEAGAIDYYGRRYGLPRAISGHNNYWLWGPGQGRGEIAIVVGQTREDCGQTYRTVIEMDRTDNPWCMPYENDVPIFLCRDPLHSLREIWPLTKDFI